MTPEQTSLALRQAHDEFPDLKLPTIDVVTPALSPQLEPAKGVPTGPASLTKEFEALHGRPLNDEQVLGQLKTQLRSLSPPFIFELARRTFAYDKQEAMTYFWLARLRAYYDATRCADVTAGQEIAAWDFAVQDIIRYGQQNPGSVKPAKLAALEREQSFPFDTSPEWICLHGIKALSAAATGSDRVSWVKPMSDWPTLHQSAREQMEKGAQNQAIPNAKSAESDPCAGARP